MRGQHRQSHRHHPRSHSTRRTRKKSWPDSGKCTPPSLGRQQKAMMTRNRSRVVGLVAYMKLSCARLQSPQRSRQRQVRSKGDPETSELASLVVQQLPASPVHLVAQRPTRRQRYNEAGRGGTPVWPVTDTGQGRTAVNCVHAGPKAIVRMRTHQQTSSVRATKSPSRLESNILHLSDSMVGVSLRAAVLSSRGPGVCDCVCVSVSTVIPWCAYSCIQ